MQMPLNPGPCKYSIKTTQLSIFNFYTIETIQLEETNVSRVMLLASLLETCNFKQFWEECAKCADLIATLTGFEDAIRKFVSHVINTTFQTIEVSVLKELLGNLNGKQLDLV